VHTHRQEKLLLKNSDRKIWLFSLPANTSHFTQPLDDVPFGRYKWHLKVQQQQLQIDIARGGGDVVEDSLLACSYIAERLAFTKPAIIKGFNDCGIYPFNEEVILDRANMNLSVSLQVEDRSALAIEAATSVINHSKKNAKRKRKSTTNGKVEVPLRQIFDPEQLAEKLREQREKKEQESAAKEARKEVRGLNKQKRQEDDEKKAVERKNHTCQECKERVWRGGKNWHSCQCGAFVVCPKCMKISTTLGLIEKHNKQCTK